MATVPRSTNRELRLGPMAQARPTGRDRILEATCACVARYGLAKTTVEDAAREAGLSRATVYRYFPGGKDQLIAEVIAWRRSGSSCGWPRRCPAPTPSPG